MEKRKILAFFNPEMLLKKEKEVRDMLTQANHKNRMKYAQEVRDAADAKA